MSPLTDEALLERLVAFDTTSHRSNLDLIDFVANYVDRPGVRVHRNHSPDGLKSNLLCWVGPRRDDRVGLTLCGHTDVVPALEDGWRSDPFTLTRDGNRWVARGSCDMKGFLALAVQRFVHAGDEPLAAPLALLLSYDEEVGSLGVQRLADDREHERLPRWVVIGEPTDLRVIGMHKGHLRLRVATEGESAHSAYPDRGVNAIEPAAEIVRRLADLRRELAAERVAASEHFPRVPFVALSVATIHGGSALNVIPDRCEIELGIRLLPGVDIDELTQRVRGAIVAAAGESGWTLTPVNVSPALAPADAALQRSVCLHAGVESPGAVDFSSDAGTLGRLGFECVLYGPGSIEVAHRPNEFLPIDQYRTATATVDRLVREHCLEPPPS